MIELAEPRDRGITFAVPRTSLIALSHTERIR